MSVRNLQLGFEAVYGVACAAPNYTALPGTKFTPGRNQHRVKPKIITGTRWDFFETRRANAEASWTLEMPLYYAMTCYPMALHMGAPVTATVFTSAFSQTFKPGGTTMLSGTFQYRKVNSQNAAGQWYQMTGCEADKLSLKMSATGIPICTFTGFGKYPTAIGAPTIATLAIEAYIHPDAATQALTKAGAAWTKVETLDLESMQGLAPDWTIQATTSMARIKLGGASGTMKVLAFQDAYSGSLMETNDGSGLIASTGVIVTFTDTVTVIGTAGSPSWTITAPLPYTDAANEKDSADDDEEEATISLAYDPTTTAGWKWVAVNMLPASTFVGH